MKHIFYVIYVLSFSSAVFLSGLYVGHLLERAWRRREQRARAVQPAQSGLELGDLAVPRTGRSE